MGFVHFDTRELNCSDCGQSELVIDSEEEFTGRLGVPSDQTVICGECGDSTSFQITPSGDVLVFEDNLTIEADLKTVLGDSD